ncbi:fibrillin-1-like [Onthophagus taurus]|uniref:fibrillin-1-like n=1 Tax=Onthophagus taurus TaxID=166361 RepID=UPI0039BE5D48
MTFPQLRTSPRRALNTDSVVRIHRKRTPNQYFKWFYSNKAVQSLIIKCKMIYYGVIIMCIELISFVSTGPISCTLSCQPGPNCKKPTCSCPNGYLKHPVLLRLCNPICSQPCINGSCIKPETCGCKRNFILNPSNKYECISKCATFCSNGTCSPQNICVCNDGFKLDKFDKFKCNPQCFNECINGFCSAPNICTCNEGFLFDHQFQCLPDCRKICKNGKCKFNGKCTCGEGYSLDEFNPYKCVPNFKPEFKINYHENFEIITNNKYEEEFIEQSVINETQVTFSTENDFETNLNDNNEEKLIQNFTTAMYETENNFETNLNDNNEEELIQNFTTAMYETENNFETNLNDNNEEKLIQNFTTAMYETENNFETNLNDNNEEKLIQNFTTAMYETENNFETNLNDNNEEKLIQNFTTAMYETELYETTLIMKNEMIEITTETNDNDIFENNIILPRNLCDIGYILKSNNCVPHCETPCINSYCSGPNICTCKENFIPDAKLENKCVPKCEMECVENAKCIDGKMCVCLEGYEQTTNPFRCNKPEKLASCTRKCANGVCVEANTCQCNPGYVKDPKDDSSCLPSSCDVDCINGKCVCRCDKNFEFNITTKSCEKSSGKIMIYNIYLIVIKIILVYL